MLDEADFRFSDATADLTKVLNNGNVNGLPVLRTMTNRNRELNPQAFRVFGPKILAMRESFQDAALESRFLTEQTGGRPLPPHIPIHLPRSLKDEARELRNKLLGWRLRERANIAPDPERLLAGASARANQTALALLSLVDDDATRERIGAYLRGEEAALAHKPLERPEGRVLSAVVEAVGQVSTPTIPISIITQIFNRNNLEKYHLPVSNKWIGSILRTRLRISTVKSHGVYVISPGEQVKVDTLTERFGLVIPKRVKAEEPADGADLHAFNETA